jgi:hypothetical protein
MVQDRVSFRYLVLAMEKYLLLLPDGATTLSASNYIASSTLFTPTTTRGFHSRTRFNNSHSNDTAE